MLKAGRNNLRFFSPKSYNKSKGSFFAQSADCTERSELECSSRLEPSPMRSLKMAPMAMAMAAPVVEVFI